MNEPVRINWYRCKVDKAVMSELMKSSDSRALAHIGLQLGFFVLTTLGTYWVYTQVHVTNWYWMMPVLLAAMWVHGTFASFLGMGGPVHELCHKTPFRTKWLNEVFLQIFAFLSWGDYISFRLSHVKHHQVTVHSDLDGEVVLPSKFDGESVKFFFTQFVCDPVAVYRRLRDWVWGAVGPEETRLKNWPDWIKFKIMPQSNTRLRRQHRRWLQAVLAGHLLLATLFIVTGHWFMILLVNCTGFYAGWLVMVVGTPQHIGLSPDVPDHRLCCRTFTCGLLPGFLYWNMQYHIEHHMFPGVPFYNLPRLHEVVKHDMPPVTDGLWNTWKALFPILKKQKVDPTYLYIPPLPQNSGDVAGDDVLEREAEASWPEA